jgi:transposase
MNSEIIEHLAQKIDVFDPPQRRRKLSTELAIECICTVLQSGIPWKHLKIPSMSYYTVYKRFQHWSKSNILEKAWKVVLSEYSERRKVADPTWFKELFIDSTMIKNVSGHDGLGKNPTDRGRLATKMSVICDTDQVPVSCTFYPANKPDVTTLLESVEAIACNVKKDGRYSTTLIGDKGYICKAHAECLRRQKRMKVLTPTKTNAKTAKKMPQKDKDSLRRRHRVENLFCRLDKFRRLHFRYERSLTSYKALNDIAMMIITLHKCSKTQW